MSERSIHTGQAGAADRPTRPVQAVYERELEDALRAELGDERYDELKTAAWHTAQQGGDPRAGAQTEAPHDADHSAVTGADLRDEANRKAPSKLLLGLILLLLLLFILAVAGRLPGFGSGASSATSAIAAARPGRLEPKLAGPTATALVPSGSTINGVAGIDPAVSELFAPYYAANNGARVFGLPISPLLDYNGRQVQWFERARLEYRPEFRGTPFEVEPALLGLEFTGERQFPTQAFFTSRPGLRYFAETGHGVGDQFLDYWDANGGLAVFGYPISDVVVEVLPETGRSHSVQYFERARFELHPRPDGTQEVMLGLLGRALYLQEGISQVGAAPEPTDVPIP